MEIEEFVQKVPEPWQGEIDRISSLPREDIMYHLMYSYCAERYLNFEGFMSPDRARQLDVLDERTAYEGMSKSEILQEIHDDTKDAVDMFHTIQNVYTTTLGLNALKHIRGLKDESSTSLNG